MIQKNILLFVLLIFSFFSKAQLNNNTVKSQVTIGKASFYANHYEGKRTATGALYNPKQLTAAHSTLPLGSKVKVIDLQSKKAVIVTINDRCKCERYGRVLDLSYAAAQQLEIINKGVAKVKLIIL